MAHVRFLMTQNANGECNTARIVDGDPGPGEVARSLAEAWAAVPGFPIEVVDDDDMKPKRKRSRK
jgi:hypothetical protein